MVGGLTSYAVALTHDIQTGKNFHTLRVRWIDDHSLSDNTAALLRVKGKAFGHLKNEDQRRDLYETIGVHYKGACVTCP